MLSFSKCLKHFWLVTVIPHPTLPLLQHSEYRLAPQPSGCIGGVSDLLSCGGGLRLATFGFCPLEAGGHPRRCRDITLGPKSPEDCLSAISLSIPGQLGTLGKDNRQALCGRLTLIVTSPGPGGFGKVRAVYKERHAPVMTQSHLPGHSWLVVCFSSLVSEKATFPGQLVTFAVHIVTHQPTLSWRRIRAL